MTGRGNDIRESRQRSKLRRCLREAAPAVDSLRVSPSRKVKGAFTYSHEVNAYGAVFLFVQHGFHPFGDALKAVLRSVAAVQDDAERDAYPLHAYSFGGAGDELQRLVSLSVSANPSVHGLARRVLSGLSESGPESNLLRTFKTATPEDLLVVCCASPDVFLPATRLDSYRRNVKKRTLWLFGSGETASWVFGKHIPPVPGGEEKDTDARVGDNHM